MSIATHASGGALSAFSPGLAAAQVDQSLRQALATYDQARRCALLWFCEVLSRELYRDLGYPSMEQYAIESLGFSRNRMWQFMRLARDLDRLPPVKEAVASGQLEWTKAQQFTRIATPRTAQNWVDRAAAKVAAKEAVVGQSVLELGRGGAAAACGTEAAKKSGAIAATATREEAILTGMAALLEGEAGRAPEVEHAHSPAAQPATAAQDPAPAGPDLRRRKSANPDKVVFYRCEACETTEVVTSAGRHKLDPASATAALENAVVHKNGKNRHAIAPATREKVLARDGHRCRAPGCHRTRFLEIHHVIPREQGGSNTLENLVTLCNRCHGFVHEKRQAATGFLAGAPGP